jgi:chorismate--pyruvate lyase
LSAKITHSVLLEPAWLNYRRGRPAGVPAPWFDWLRDQGSLTQRVLQACSGRFRVHLLHQGWGVPLASERRLLGMGRTRTSMLREVELRCDDAPWVFARTVIPARSLRGRARRLAHLGERPLGAVLFADPTTRRGRVEFARLRPGQPLFEAAVINLQRPPAELWGRRTVFYYAGKPLLVNEIFLPGVADA